MSFKSAFRATLQCHVELVTQKQGDVTLQLAEAMTYADTDKMIFI